MTYLVLQDKQHLHLASFETPLCIRAPVKVCSQPSWDSQRTRPSVDEDQPGVVCLPSKAGDAVVFLSKYVRVNSEEVYFMSLT